MRILDGKAFIISALASKNGEHRYVNKVFDIPHQEELEELSDFEQALIKSQIALLPIQQEVIRECIRETGVNIDGACKEIYSIAEQLEQIRLTGGANNGTD